MKTKPTFYEQEVIDEILHEYNKSNEAWIAYKNDEYTLKNGQKEELDFNVYFDTEFIPASDYTDDAYPHITIDKEYSGVYVNEEPLNVDYDLIEEKVNEEINN